MRNRMVKNRKINSNKRSKTGSPAFPYKSSPEKIGVRALQYNRVYITPKGIILSLSKDGAVDYPSTSSG